MTIDDKPLSSVELAEYQRYSEITVHLLTISNVSLVTFSLDLGVLIRLGATVVYTEGYLLKGS
jgi:hypothetical protein